MTITLEPLTVDKLPQFKSLLSRPEFDGCFCAVWTSFNDTWLARCQDPTRPNFDITAREVKAGRQAGFLVYQQQTLIGWTGSGPKTEFPALQDRLGSRLSDHTSETWVIGCLALKADYRGQGYPAQVIAAVIEQARQAGASMVEAYPTSPWDEPRSYRGALTTFERLGFRRVAQEPDGASEIVLMQLLLTETEPDS